MYDMIQVFSSIKNAKVLKFLVSVTLVSFLLSYATGFSFFFACNFHYLSAHNFHYLSALVFPIFAHALERKYMFLICNAILAFLVNTLEFNNSDSLPPVSDDNYLIKDDHDDLNSCITITTTTTTTKAISQNPHSSESTVLDIAGDRHEEEDNEIHAHGLEDKLKLQEKGKDIDEQVKVCFGSSGNHDGASSCRRLQAERLMNIEDVEMNIEEEEEEEVMELEGGRLVCGGSAAEEEGGVNNINTEELNHKFEEFIRKMKEEIRIQAQQQPQLIVTV